MRLTSEFFVSAYLRRCHKEGQFAALRRRGAPESGAIFILVDKLDGCGVLYGPAAQADYTEGQVERAFTKLHKADALPLVELEARLNKEIAFDSDCWIVELEAPNGQHFLEPVL